MWQFFGVEEASESAYQIVLEQYSSQSVDISVKQLIEQSLGDELLSVDEFKLIFDYLMMRDGTVTHTSCLDNRCIDAKQKLLAAFK
ncbi:MAG: hypothetical protein GJ680_18620 [Alteromonadaceae bacterium]|nr:hypothetical protein [Alteromonadaceae bacterium]